MAWSTTTKIDAESFQLTTERNELVEIAGEPIELGDHDHGQFPAARSYQHEVESRPPFLRTADAVVHVLCRVPAAGRSVALKRDELGLHRADPSC